MYSLLRSGQAGSSYSCVLLSRACRKHALAFSTTRAAARSKSKSRKGPSRSSNHFARSGSSPPFQPSLNPSNQEDSSPSPRRDPARAYGAFRRLALNRLSFLINGSGRWDPKREEYKAFGLPSKLDFDREVMLFRIAIEKACDLASEHNATGKLDNPLFWNLRKAFVQGELPGLTDEVNYAFQNFLMRSMFHRSIEATHRKIADFRFPHEWFPATRALQRTIHLHVGPTNSGKTYNALKALEDARSGIYAGPLRLLAHEVYSRFTAKGKKCALVTGEEQRIPEGEDLYFRSCTVEMTPLNHLVDVAVIDEIQMIGDAERGWAWTQAVLGVQAKEVHLCGEERAVELIQSLCRTTGDKLVIHRYQRLSPLQTMDESLKSSWKHLQKGDAVVSFSRVGIHALKKHIEKETGRRVAVVYGSLPPETRAQQAALFNDPDNDYDFLVASDAIGMGLNLEIKRVVFEQTTKRDTSSFRQISTSEIKQIGGRAGRYRTASHAIKSGSSEASDSDAASSGKERQVGLVTALEDDDLTVIQEAFERNPEPLRTAGIQPPPSVIERFSSYFPPNTPFSYILWRLRDIAQVSDRFHMCHAKEMLTVADLIQPFPMSVYDRCVLLNAPVFLREPNGAQVLQAFARCISNMDGGKLVDIQEVNLELLDIDKNKYPRGGADYLRQLETLHKSITLYLWLTYRYSGVFTSQNLAFHVKGLVESKIDDFLDALDMTGESRMAIAARNRKAAKAAKLKKKKVLGEEGSEDVPGHEGVGDWNEDGRGEPLFEDPGDLEQATRPKPKSQRDNPSSGG